MGKITSTDIKIFEYIYFAKTVTKVLKIDRISAQESVPLKSMLRQEQRKIPLGIHQIQESRTLKDLISSTESGRNADTSAMLPAALRLFIGVKSYGTAFVEGDHPVMLEAPELSSSTIRFHRAARGRSSVTESSSTSVKTVKEKIALLIDSIVREQQKKTSYPVTKMLPANAVERQKFCK